ncbi:MAG: CvpA family protein [Clostridia bacterium]|nr:CvpA family protein [Clostridia bacterium]
MWINALNASWANIVVDIIAGIAILIFAIIAAKKGFIDCFFSLVTTILAIVLAFSLMKSVMRWTGGLFGLEDVIIKGCENALLKIKGFSLDISNAGIEAALAEQDLPKFLIDMVIEQFGNADLAAGTTLAMIVGSSLGSLITSLIAWVVVFIVAKLLLWIVKKIIMAIVDSVSPVAFVNHLLGFFIGALEGLLIVSLVVAILGIIPAEGLTNFFNECTFVKWLFHHNPLNTVLGWILV